MFYYSDNDTVILLSSIYNHCKLFYNANYDQCLNFTYFCRQKTKIRLVYNQTTSGEILYQHIKQRLLVENLNCFMNNGIRLLLFCEQQASLRHEWQQTTKYKFFRMSDNDKA
jgi:hypothetical protein